MEPERKQSPYRQCTLPSNSVTGFSLLTIACAQKSLSGPWSGESDIAPSNTRTYFSQNTFDLPISQNLAIYMGDRWRPTQLGGSRYVWYPLVWNNGPPRIVASDVWSVNLAAGTYTADQGRSYEAESGALSGEARKLSNSAYSGGTCVGYIGTCQAAVDQNERWG